MDESTFGSAYTAEVALLPSTDTGLLARVTLETMTTAKWLVLPSAAVD